MLPLVTAVALSLLPGHLRFLVADRLRSAGTSAIPEPVPGPDAPILAALLERIAPESIAGERATTLADRLAGEASRALGRARAAGLDACAWGEASYPAALAAIPDPPVVLWWRGAAPGTLAPGVAIVGARAATCASLEIARTLARDLAAAGIAVVSGLARGVDAAAHAGALEAGRTLAVLGSGGDVIYPPEHDALAARIVASGAVVTEFPPGTSPQPHHFPLRNRIISGLCRGVVVVEAAEKSGSLITARCALEQGRDVMAVPGGVLSGRNRGAHALLRDGARLVESAEDVLDEIGLPAGVRQPEGAAGGSEAGIRDGSSDDPVVQSLPPGEVVDLDVLTATSGLSAATVLARLTQLELHGAVRRAPGGGFVRLCRQG